MSTASDRVSQIGSHFGSAQSRRQQIIDAKSPSDSVIVAAVRTPMTRMKKGGLRNAAIESMLSTSIKEAVRRAGVDPALIEDVCVGNTLAGGRAAKVARMGALHAGVPYTAAMTTVNRQCASGLQAVANIALLIQTGQINCGIGGGMESMSQGFGEGTVPKGVDEDILNSPVQDARDCMLPMGITSERVAKKFNISREEQDAWAVVSHNRAAAAQDRGDFDAEIVPVRTQHDDGKPVTVSRDDGIRRGADRATLAKLKPSFQQDGASTAGNSSQTTDGAAAVLLMRRDLAERIGAPILGRFVTSRCVGVPPEIMGVGPAVAIPKLLNDLGLQKEDIDVWEINEAFASQFVYCMKELGLDPERVNMLGGAIALGHPLGCTGARMFSTLLGQLQRTNKTLGVISMCQGAGMGSAGLIVRE